LAQAVLDSPVKRAFEQIVNMDLEEEEDLWNCYFYRRNIWKA
jgi:hypothetical protein